MSMYLLVCVSVCGVTECKKEKEREALGDC